MNFPEAPIICCDFPMFNQAFGFSDNPDEVRSSLNSLCAYPYAENSLDWCSPFLASYPDTLDALPEQHLVPTFPFGCNLCEEPWIPSWHNGVPCAQQPQVYSLPTPGPLLNNTHPQFATATCPNPPFDASPVSLASNHSSNDSPPRPWDSWEASDSTVLASCTPPPLNQSLTVRPDTPSSQPQGTKKKRLRGPVDCSFCGMSFAQRCLLRDHMREHGDQYKCETCGKTFAEAGNLAVHRKMHKAGPQTCEKCFKVFTKRTSYRSHLRSHDETRPRVKCPQMGCDKEYAHQGCLNRHLKTHDARYTFTCSDCGRSFNRLDLRDRHQDKYCQKARDRRGLKDKASHTRETTQPQSQRPEQPGQQPYAARSRGSLVQQAVRADINRVDV